MPALEFIETSELLRELTKRMDAMIFVAESNRLPKKEDSLLTAFAGSLPMCLGLAEVSKLMVLTHFDEGPHDQSSN